MALGRGTHFQAPVLGATDLYEDVPIDILSRTQRLGYFIDFIEPTVNSGTGAMVSTTLTGVTSSAVLAAADNGIYQVVSDGTTAHGIGSLQFTGTTAALYAPSQDFLNPSTSAALDGSTSRHIAFGCRMRISDFSNHDWFVGLAGIDTTLILGTGLLATTGADNFVGFHHVVHANSQGGLTGPDGNAVRYAAAGGGVANYQAVLSTSTSATVPQALPADSAVDNVFFEFGVRIRGTTFAEFYINRTLRHRMTLTNALAAKLVPSWGFIDNGAAVTSQIDYFWAMQTR